MTKTALKLAITLLATLLVLSVLGRLIRFAQAETAFYDASDADRRLSACLIDPETGDYFKGVGDTWLHVAIPPRPALAAQAYGEAVRKDPYGSVHWLDWGRACKRAGDREQAGKAFSAALALDPNNQFVQLEAGDYFLELGDPVRATGYHARAIDLNPALARALYPVYWGLGESPAEVARRLRFGGAKIPPAYLMDCLAWAEPNQIRELWNDFQDRGIKFPPAVMERYFTYLADRADLPALREVWAQIVRESYGKTSADPNQLFWNGDLRLPLAFPGGLEWRIGPNLPAGVEVTSSTTGGAGGGGGLDLRFSGQENVTLNHIRHRFLVDPGVTYELSARYRAQGITTQYGLYLEVRLQGDTAPKRSEPLILGTGEGTARVEFTAAPGCHLGELAIRRDRCPYFSNRIGGHVKLSDFRMEKVAAGQKLQQGNP